MLSVDYFPIVCAYVCSVLVISDTAGIFGNYSVDLKGTGVDVLKWVKSRIVSDSPDDVRFFLFPNPNDKNYTEELKYMDEESLAESNFRRGQQLKIVIHGFTKDYLSRGVQLIKNAYLEQQLLQDNETSPNIILVDWEPLANPRARVDLLFYRFAVSNIPQVGTRVAEFVHYLIKQNAILSEDHVHIIGFSLGAHVAGQAGRTLKELSGNLPNRVTGLDPAGPAFYKDLPFSSKRLQSSDGEFVDIIHTNMGGLGTTDIYGHANFFPNGGGNVQPRCMQRERKRSRSTFGRALELLDVGNLVLQSCSHNKAPEFYSMSILNPNMTSCQCENYQEFKLNTCNCSETATFGESVDSSSRGKFYLDI